MPSRPLPLGLGVRRCIWREGAAGPAGGANVAFSLRGCETVYPGHYGPGQ